MVDHVEARFDVTFQHPLIGAGGELVNLRDRVLGSPSGTEAIRAWLEVRLQDRLQHQLEGRLRGAIPRGRDAQPSQLAATRLGDHPFPHRKWSEPPRFEIISQLRKKLLLGGQDRLWPKPADPRRPLPPVAPDPRPRHNEDRRVTHEVEQVIEPAIRIIDRPLMQLDLDPQYLRLGQFPIRPQHVGIHRRSPTLPDSRLRTHCRPSPCDRLSRPRTTTTAPPHPWPLSRRRADPPPVLDAQPAGPAKDASHVHRAPVDGVGGQLCPCGIATSTPQTFLVASLPATSPGPRVAHQRWACTALRPISARFEPVYLLRGFTRWFLTSTFPSR